MNIYIYIFLVHQKPHDLVHMFKTYVVTLDEKTDLPKFAS